jgi:hypothetical protein
MRCRFLSLLKEKPGFPSWPAALCGWGDLCTHEARRYPGLELSPVTEKIIKSRVCKQQLSSELRHQCVGISGFSRSGVARGVEATRCEE